MLMKQAEFFVELSVFVVCKLSSCMRLCPLLMSAFTCIFFVTSNHVLFVSSQVSNLYIKRCSSYVPLSESHLRMTPT